MQRVFAILLLLLLWPVFLLLWIFVKLDDDGPFIFIQKRMGKDEKVFDMIKIRSMVVDADKHKEKLLIMNEADTPAFKIYKDPRHTKVGRILAHTGLDELPQLINVIKGDMDLVGPRPLPVDEARRIPKKYQARFSVLPGITSTWVVQGAHEMGFDEWMKLDLADLKDRSALNDINILLLTVVLISKSLILQMKKVLFK